ncbi:cyclophilin-like domain-containing protein [Pelagophyceae sp. CCMP2097]|nr:cyclophilin-like domain-containing protein [Pelagophyceae sp. CCMP2097]
MAFTARVDEFWAPLGAMRLLELVEAGHLDGVAFFRVIDKFMAQFGINGNLTKQAAWRGREIRDEALSPMAAKASNVRGTISFACSGPNTRNTQLFINFGDNSRLDAQRFWPVAEIIDGGMATVDFIHAVGEGAPKGKGPAQGRIQAGGDDYLLKEFPQLTRIVSARVRPAARPDAGEVAEAAEKNAVGEPVAEARPPADTGRPRADAARPVRSRVESLRGAASRQATGAPSGAPDAAPPAKAARAYLAGAGLALLVATLALLRAAASRRIGRKLEASSLDEAFSIPPSKEH